MNRSYIQVAATTLLAVAATVLAVQYHSKSEELRSFKADAERYRSFSVWLMIRSHNQAFTRMDDELDAKEKLREYMTPEALAKVEAALARPSVPQPSYMPARRAERRDKPPVDKATLDEIAASAKLSF